MVAIFTGLGAGFTRGSGTLLGGSGQLGSSLLGRGGESVSVNAASGNLLVSHQDEFLVGLGPDVAIARTYNSLSDAADGDNGDQWQQSTTRRVFGLTGTQDSAGSTVSRLGADGSVVVYAWDAARSAYVTKDGAGAFDTLTCASDVWTWRDGDTQATETYAQYGAGNWRIAAAADADGNGLTFSYNADKLDKVTTADGAWTQYAWSGNAITQVVTGYTDLATSTAKTLTRVRYGYDGQGRLQSVTTDLTPDDNAVSDANTYVVTYTYDGTSNRIASIAQTDGSLLQIAYDGSDRVQTLTQTVASGVTRVTTLAYGSGYTSVTGPDGQVTRLDYDGSGRLTKITAPPAASGATAQTVQFAYDADGNLDSVTDGAGKVTSYDYDASGNATLVTDPTGHTVTRSYDAQNRLITELTSGADRDGTNVSHYSQYVYDAEGHLRFAVNAAGQVTEYRYTAAGQLARTIQFAENRMTPPGAAAIGLATAEAWVAGIADKSSVRITENSYDVRGNLIRTTQYSDLYVNRVGNSAFDSTAGWLVGFNPNGIASGDPYPVTQSGKNAIKLNISATAAGQQASLCTDGDHFMEVTPGERLFVQVGVELLGAAVSPVLAVQFRDADGNYLGAANIASGTGNQPYDTKLSGFLVVPEGVARVRLEVYAFTSGAGTGSFSIIEPMITPVSDEDAAPIYTVGEGGFDAGLTAGNAPAALSRAHYVYDQAGRLLESWREGENHEAFFYDGMGRLVQSTDRNGGTTTIVFADATTTTTITNAAGFTSVSVYNKAGELVSLTESGANTTAGTASYQYDAAGRLRVVTDATGRKSYVYYDKAGRKVAEANHLGEVTEYRYDAAGRVVATVTYATALSGSALTAMGNVASTADFSTLRPSSSANDVWGWTVYDDAGRIIQAIDNLGSTVRYEYDTEGKLAKTTAYYNRLSSSQLTAFKANPPATLQLPTAHANDTVARVFYNKAGQQIGTLDGEGYLSETIRDGAGLEIQTTFYAAATNAADRASGSYGALKAGITTSSADRISYSVYDGQGLLRYSVNARGGIVSYDYDAAGRLIKTTAYANEVALTDYTYDAVKGAVIVSGADRISRTVYDAAGRTAFTVDAEGGVVAFQYDAAGRVTKAVAFDNPYTSTVSLSALDSWSANTTQASDAKNRITRSWYNARGEVVFSLDAENYVTGYAYDAEGRVLSTTRYGGSWVTVSDTTTIAQLAALLVGTPTSTAITVSQTYDNAGRVLTSTDGEGTVTRNTYDALGQLTDVTVAYGHADAATTHYTYDGTGRVLTVTAAFGMAEAATVTYAYDGLGNRTSVTDARGNATTYTFDRQGRVLTATNALGGVSTYVYDAFGQVVKLTDPRGKSTYTYYDRLGRLVTTRDAENYVTRTSYNRFGEAVDVRRYATAFTGTAQIGVNPTGDPDSSYSGPSPAVLAAYANAAQLQSDADTAAAALAAEQAALAAALANPLPTLQNKLSQLQAQRATVQAQYDAANWLDRLLVYGPQLTSIDSDISKVNTNLTRVNNGQALNSWGTDLVNGSFNVAALQSQYNTAQATASQALADAQALEAAEQGGGDFGSYSGTAYTYDRLGRVATKIDAEGYGESYAYNAFGNLVTLRRYPGAITGSSYNQTSFEYDERGSITQTTDAEGWIESYTYDAFGRRASLVSKNATIAKAADGTTIYAYDKNGRLTSETLPIQGYNSAGNSTGTIKNTYTYDKRGNLTQTSVLEGSTTKRTITYTYDKLDRKLTTAGASVTGVTIDVLTKAVSTVSGVPTETIVYDANGNVIRTTDAAGATSVFYYDALNRKTSEVNALGTVTTYAYDANGNVEKVRIYEHALNMVQSSTGKNFSLVPYDLEGWAAKVHRMYDIALGRLAVSTEVENWVYRAVNMYGNTSTALQSICSEILGDSGVQARLSATNVTTFVTQMYQLGFGRNPTSAEVTTWVTAINNGSSTRGAMLAVFVDHLDHRARVDGAIAALAFGTPNLDAIEPAKYRETSFTYDALGRMLKSSVILPSGYKTGVWNGSSWTNATTASLDTSYQYDYLGNAVKVTDPNGNATFSYYDKLSRMTAQLDAEGYLTAWTYNSESNVTNERRYNAKYTGTPTTANPPSVSTNAADRVTAYTYDKVGNRTKEERAGVVVYNGSGGTSTVTATIQYTYNGLGQVLTKTEATGDVFTYAYDAGGRLTKETRPSFASNNGTSVTPQLNYYYDGLGNLTRSVQAGGGDAVQRVTTYAYGAGGRLSSMTDAEGGVRNYLYDVAGRLVLEHYTRTITATGGGTSTVNEGIGYRYDALGRSLGQGFYTKPGSTWTFQSGNDWSALQYNAFGDVVKMGVNGALQQENKYDEAGRLWATNQGDGVWKYYGYDKNGNQTVAIASAGADTSGKSFVQAFAMIAPPNVNGTYTVYDKRGLATSVIEEGRELTASGTSTLTTSRTYNAYGEVATETNAAGAKITYTYNTMGRKIRSESPTVSITLEDGTTRYVKPSEDYYYDASGRLVATRDANGTYATGGSSTNGASKAANTGNLNRLTLLAGTGYDGGQALVTHELHADGGTRQVKYDIMGDARVVIDEEGRTVTTNLYDKLGRLTKATLMGGLVDSYSYDVLGQKVEHGNSAYSTLGGGSYLDGNTEITVYDIQGRIVSSRAWGGDITNYSYAWDGTLEAIGTGLTDTGGWSKVTTYANTLTSTEKSDIFGRSIYKSDLGGHVTTYTYDLAGRLTKSETTNGSNVASYNYEYYNTGQVKKAYTIAQEWYLYGAYPNYDYYSYSTTTQQISAYTYDAVGNRLTEYGTTVVNGGTPTVWKNHTATYDALGRLISVDAAAAANHAAATTNYEYDAKGNIRKKSSTFYLLQGNGSFSSTQNSIANWFRYDSMDRIVLNNGILNDGQIVRRPYGVEQVYSSWGEPPSESVTYNKAGDRISVTTTQATFGTSYPAFWVTGYYEQKNTYAYDSAGRLETISEVSGAEGPDTAPYSPPVASGTGVVRSRFGYDALGRQISQSDYNAAGTQVVFNSTTTYNTKGQISGSFSSALKTDGKTYTSTTTNAFGTAGTTSYALGAVVSSTSVNTVTGQSSKTSLTSNTFQWWDAALQNTTSYDSDTGSSSNAVHVTTFYYNPLGQLNRAQINDGMPRTVTFSLDELGQVIRRDETKPSNAPSAQQGSPHEVWYRFGDREFGHLGNDAGSEEAQLGTSIYARQAVPSSMGGTFNNSSTTGWTVSDFSQSFEKINSFNQGSRASSYTVRNGDTLQGLAQRLYGDAGLWYKIAEVNGLGAGSQLMAGQQIQLPGGVIRSTNSADNYKPYDPASAIGDLSPTTPKPPKKPGCGSLGVILLMAIAVAVTLITKLPIAKMFAGMGMGSAVGTGAAIGGSIGVGSAAGIAGAATAAALGSVVSQAVGIATGIQDKFSWKGVAMSAIGAGIGAGLGDFAAFGEKGLGGLTNVANDVVRGAAGSLATQGIGVATRLQDKFSWAGVAAAGVAGAVGGGIDRSLPAGLDSNVAGAISGTASLIASAATRSAIEGTSFEANLLAGLPDVIGQVLGRALAGEVNAAGERRAARRTAIATNQALAEAAADNAGLAPGSSERAAYVAQLVGRKDVTDAIYEAQYHHDSDALKYVMQTTATDYFGQDQLAVATAAAALEYRVSAIPVPSKADGYALILSPADTLALSAGALSNRIDALANDHPAIGAAVNMLVIGAAIVDPIGTLGGIGLGKLVEQGQPTIEGRFTDAGYDRADAEVGGEGSVFLVGILGGGMTSKIGGFLENSFSKIFGRSAERVGQGASPALKGDPYHPDSVAARVRPEYKGNPAHDQRSPLYNPKKTPEPADAATVYSSAQRTGMGTWIGRASDGRIYQFFSDNAGGVHFSGILTAAEAAKKGFGK